MVLNDSNVSLERIQMTMQDAFIMMDPLGRISYWNQGAQDIFGWSKEETLGKDLHELIAPKRYHTMYQKGFSHFIKTGKGPAINKTLTLSARHKDGHEFTIELTLAAVDIEGKWYAVGVVRDKAIQKQLEFQQLHMERLESISTLAAGFSHDFNNILASIIGYTELALDDAEKGTLLFNNLNEVLTAGNRAKDLVQQILKFGSQLDSQKEAVHLKSLIQESMKLVRASFPKDIDIKLDLTSDRHILADPSRIHQIISNLCTNACHAMKNEGQLKVSLKDVEDHDKLHAPKQIEDTRDFVRFSIEDTGMGMSRDILSRAFNPFFTTREQGEGRGMGLPMVHGIVSNLNGWIEPVSEPGKGTCFDIYLPVLSKSDSDHLNVPVQDDQGAGQILFVDDEDPITRMSKQLLERMGYKVEALTSSPEALERFRSSPESFYLVITDLAMPNMNGLDLSRELLRIRPDIPIIMCTGYGISISDNEAEEAGIKAIVYKPILSDQMAETIGRVLSL